MFALSLVGMGFVQQQFFPSSDRPELIVDWNLPQNSSIAETNAQMARFEKEALQGNPDIDHWSTYVGQGALRFVLSFDVQPADPYVRPDRHRHQEPRGARPAASQNCRPICKKTFPGTDAFVKLLDIGPPVGRPVQYRVSGPDIGNGPRPCAAARRHRRRATRISATWCYDWNEPARVVKVDVLQDKARQLGITSEDIASTLNGIVDGTVDHAGPRRHLSRQRARRAPMPRSAARSRRCRTCSCPAATASRCRSPRSPPSATSSSSRRSGAASRLPTITVKAGILDSVQPATVVDAAEADDRGVHREAARRLSRRDRRHASRRARKAQAPIVAVVPLMLFVMATILMIQLQSFQRLFLVFAVAPLALIGVVAALLPSGAPIGFVAILGVLALIGILIRNSVILIVQIETSARARAGRHGTRSSRRPNTACGRSC